jgi:hypothetical protein
VDEKSKSRKREGRKERGRGSREERKEGRIKQRTNAGEDSGEKGTLTPY